MKIKKINSNLLALVNILNDGYYHDGESLGKQLGMTRAAICKLIKKLKSYGVCINSIKRKGYALLDPLVLLDKCAIQQSLTHVIDIDIFESLPSTNDYLKSFKRLTQPKICLAEQQTHGKGRLNREWYSPFGQNIYFSCLYFMERDISELAGLSLIVSLAVIKLLNQYYIPNTHVKWPNDILFQQCKLSGSLIEVEAESHGICRIIIGIGININMLSADDNNINQKWTSLRAITKNYFDRNKICALLIEILLIYLKKFEHFGFETFIQEWQAVDFLRDKQLSLKCGQREFKGLARGINHLGNLLLEVDHGIIKTFSSGDTSIIK